MPNIKTTNTHCLTCGKELIRPGKYCSRSCHCTANSAAIKAWEHNVGKEMEKDGWMIFRPASCCDRLGVKDGLLYFLEFKPQGKTELREYQEIVRDLVPHMYRVVVGNWNKENVEILKIKGGYLRKHSRRPKQLSTKPSISKFRGVYWNSKSQKWRVRIMLDGRRFSLRGIRPGRGSGKSLR